MLCDSNFSPSQRFYFRHDVNSNECVRRCKSETKTELHFKVKDHENLAGINRRRTEQNRRYL